MKKSLFAIAAMLISVIALAQTSTQGNIGPAQYKLGTHGLRNPSNTHNQTPFRFSAGGDVTGLDACAFDPKASISDMFSNIESQLATLKDLPATIAAALPGYIFCRAKPGLCQLLQDYIARLEAQYALHVKNCETAVQEAIAGNSSIHDWVVLAEVDAYKKASSTGQSSQVAYRNATKSRGTNGLPWIGGKNYGGRGQAQIQPVRHVAAAGWCASQNKDPNCQTGDPTSVYSEYWKDSVEMKAWIATVTGDIGLWVYKSAPPPTSIAGTGLEPLIRERQEEIIIKLEEVLQKDKEEISDDDLEALSTRNTKMTPDLIKAVSDKQDTEGWIVENLANRIATGQIVDKALYALYALRAGRQEPNVQAIEPAQKAIDEAIERLKEDIDLTIYASKARNALIGDFGVEVLSDENITTSENDDKTGLDTEKEN